MGNTIGAHALLDEMATGIPAPHEKIVELFADSLLDFPVQFTQALPFGAHRFGMVGITLRGKVWLMTRIKDYHPIEVLSLLRHEAEHVRQQRKTPIFFYPIYGLSYLFSFLNPWPSERLKTFREQYGRSNGAYRAIPYEVEAYGAGDGMRSSLRRLIS